MTALIFGSFVFLQEGAICVVMGGLLFYPLGWLGGWMAAALSRRSNNRTPPAMVALLPLLLMPFEQPGAYPTMDATVVTQIEIAAPIEVVWREAVEIRDIADHEQTWTFTHDLAQIPRPTDARLLQRGDQRVRAATWRGDVRFYEVIGEWKPNRAVAWTFDIPEAAADRMLDRHLRLDEEYLRLHGGRYDLEAISPTRTRLTLRTRYSARTPFNLYARAWGALLLGDIHRNVLNVVRQRAERATGS